VVAGSGMGVEVDIVDIDFRYRLRAKEYVVGCRLSTVDVMRGAGLIVGL